MVKAREYIHRSIDVWDEEKQPVIEGVIARSEEMEVDDEVRETFVIETPDGFVRIWHSGALKEAFELGKVGDGIRLHYKGRKALSGAKTFKRISVAVWKGGDIEEIIEAHEARQKNGGKESTEG